MLSHNVEGLSINADTRARQRMILKMPIINCTEYFKGSASTFKHGEHD